MKKFFRWLPYWPTRRDYFAAQAMQGLLASPHLSPYERIGDSAARMADLTITALDAEKVTEHV